MMPDSPTDGPGAPGSANNIAGRYALTRKVGDGALFTVYEASDRQTGQTVAVKVLRPAFMRDAALVESLLAEATAARSLHHHNIAGVLDAGQDQRAVYIVTEFVAGDSLQDRLVRGEALPMAVAVNIAAAVADALAHAHQQGMVHGDLRPQNILFASDGQVKVTDFGLARALAASDALEPSSVLQWVRCMAPEVAEGQPASPTSDTYSLGCVLYEMLTGAPAFPGENALVVALKHAREMPRPVRQANSSVPPALAAVVNRALEKTADRRFPDAAAMLVPLRQAQDALRYNKPLDYTPAHVLTPLTTPQPHEDVEEEEPVPRSLVILRNIVLTLIGVIITGSIFYLYTVLQPQKDVPVPEVVGKTTDEARRLLGESNLQWTVMERESARPAGEVLNQQPDAGQSVKPGRIVTLYVSRGPQLISVPAVTEMSLDRAEQIAQDAGLVVKRTASEFNEDVQEGYVVSQTPGPNEKVKPGRIVKVVVSKGPKPPPEPEPEPEPQFPIAPAYPSVQPVAPLPPEQRTGRPRSFNISFQVPAQGYQEPVMVQVFVFDERGENAVAEERRRLGDVVTKRIDAVGERVLIRVYLNGQFFSEETK